MTAQQGDNDDAGQTALSQSSEQVEEGTRLNLEALQRSVDSSEGKNKIGRIFNFRDSLFTDSAATQNLLKSAVIVLLAISTVGIMAVGSFKYLCWGCGYDKDEQKEAGAIVQSVISGVIGIVAGMGLK
jgi:rRNA maturation endonuclease Nob1